METLIFRPKCLLVALFLLLLVVGAASALATPMDSTKPGELSLPVPDADACITWNLAADFQLWPNQANPGPDSCGQVDVWYFLESASLDRDPATYALLPEFVQDIAGIVGLQGWRGVQYPELPVIGLNTTGITQTHATWVWPPDVIYVHPTPTQMVIAGWHSPVDGVVAISGGVRDLDGDGGDGIEWYIDQGATNLAFGDYWNGGAQDFEDGTGGSSLADVPVSQGEFIYFIVHPRSDYDYDSTELDVTITLLRKIYLPLILCAR